MTAPSSAITHVLVCACERLLELLTGPAISCPENQAAALEAIELLALIENELRTNATTPLGVLHEDALAKLTHRHQVLCLLHDVLDALAAQGCFKLALGPAPGTGTAP